MVKLIRWSVICGTRSAVRRREVVHWASYSTFTALHYTILPYITLHYLTLHNTTSPYITINYLTLRYFTLQYTTLPNTTLTYLGSHGWKRELAPQFSEQRTCHCIHTPSPTPTPFLEKINGPIVWAMVRGRCMLLSWGLRRNRLAA